LYDGFRMRDIRGMRNEVAVVVMGVLLLAVCELGESKRRIMPWMCLQLCDFTEEDIASHLTQLEEHKDTLSAVAFEHYHLGPNSELLIFDNVTVVNPQIQRMGLEAWAMISSFPYPDDFIDWMRQVFATPDPFFAQCIKEGVTNNYTGFNVDWEPAVGATEADSVAYANFLTEMTTALAPHGLQVSVDAATWTPLWNYTLLSESAVNKVITMATYVGTPKGFLSNLNQAVDEVGTEKLGVGLQTINPNTGDLLPLPEVAWRVKKIIEEGVTEIDIWDCPVPSEWWPILEFFAHGDE